MGLLYGRAGRLNTRNGGFRPGQEQAEAVAARGEAERELVRKYLIICALSYNPPYKPPYE
jgi:hypothetical protein